ncbi:glycosyltransferase family 4 protein [Paenarthrobacter sp. NPDC057981]|uniref:glycosyltransferase family 4 protein n=1 Tax=Paenarthrobacter sp. NPDC057981 TaxID=3346297 RepID=UPI0036DD53AD
MKPLKIAMIVSHLSPAYGLEAISLSTMQLLRSKYSVEMICVGGSTRDLEVCRDALVLGSPLRDMGRLRTIWRLFKVRSKIDADVIILAGTWVALPWLLVAGKLAAKSVVWEHSLLKERFSVSSQMRLLAGAAAVLYSKAAAVVTVSEALGSYMRELLGHANVLTIPNAVAKSKNLGGEFVRGSTKQTEYRLLNVGSLTPLKAQHLLIEAVSLLDDRFVLTIVGNGAELQRLRELATSLGVQSRVNFSGYLESSELRKLYTDSDMMVHSAVAETFGLVYVEAAQAGLPVLSTRSSVSEEMIPGFVPGWICEPQATSIAESIVRHQDNPPSEDCKLEAESRRESHFGPHAVLSKWSELLETLNSR